MDKLVARTWGRIAFLLFAMALAAAEPSIAIALRLAEGSYSESILNAALESLVLIAGALLIIRLLHVLVWHGLVTRQSGGPPPRLLTDLVDVAVLTITLTLVIAFVFDMPVNGLIATSGVAVVDSTVIEINKAAMEPILMRRVELMEAMSTVLADRQLMNARAGEVSRTPSEVREERRTLAHLLLGRMRAFFRIGAPAS